MTPSVAQKIDRLRAALEATPGGVVAGDIRRGLGVEPDVGSPAYAEFLSKSDGGRFGGVDLWGRDELNTEQYCIDDEIPGGSARWLCVGRITTDVLLLDRKTGEVRLFAPPYARPEAEGVKLGSLDRFLDQVVLGPEYVVVVGDSPAEWIDHLRTLGFVPGGSP